MSSPTDLLTAAINRAVREAVQAELAPVIARLEKAESPTATVSDDFLSPAQVSELTGIAKSTLADWRAQDRGPEFVRMGKAIRYRRSDIDAWITDVV